MTSSTAVAERVPINFSTGLSSFLVALVGLIGANLMPFKLIALEEDLHVSSTFAGGMMTASLLGTAGIAVLTMKLVAGPSRKRVAQSGLIVASIGYGVTALSSHTGLSTVAVVLAGMGAGAAVAAGGAALAVFHNPNRVMGFNVLFNRGSIAAVLAIIPLISLATITVFGAAALICLAALAGSTKLPSAPSVVEAATNETRSTATLPYSKRAITLAGLATLLLFAFWALSEDSLWAIAGAMGAAQANFGEELLGLALSLSTVGGLVGALVIIIVGDKFGRALPLAILLVLGSVLKWMSSIETDPVWYAVLLIAWNFVYGILYTLIIATAAGLDATGKWSGPTLGIYLVGSAFAPIFATSISEFFGYQVFGVTIALMSAISAIPLFIIGKMSTRIEKVES